MSSDNFYVYAYLREDRTPYYIGKGKGQRAFKKHCCSVPTDLSRIIILVAGLAEEYAFQLERQLIANYGRKNLGSGILRNLTDGGEGPSGMVISIDHRKKLSDAMKGKKKTAEHAAKVRAANLGKKRSPEVSAKFSLIRKGLPAHNKGKKTGPLSEDHRKSLSVARAGKKQTHKQMSSSFNGLYLHLPGTWRARIRIDGKTKHIGVFGSEVDAAIAYDKKVIELGLNYPLNFTLEQVT
jgi:hypothetical protein